MQQLPRETETEVGRDVRGQPEDAALAAQREGEGRIFPLDRIPFPTPRGHFLLLLKSTNLSNAMALRGVGGDFGTSGCSMNTVK